MKIKIKTTFLDGRDRFEAGDARTVDDADGARFIANGWAYVVGGEASPPDSGPVTLDIHDAKQGQGAKNG